MTDDSPEHPPASPDTITDAGDATAILPGSHGSKSRAVSLNVQGLGAEGLLLHALQSGGPASREWLPPTSNEVADLLPQFSIEKMIGRGGMGSVYKGEQKELGRSVAVKLLPAELAVDPHFTVRFEREARTLASLQHTGIVAVYESGRTSAGHLYFVMEYVDGADLMHLLEAGRGVDPSQALGLVVQICEALQFAHDKGVVHRDIKPANVLISRDGRAKLADFGLARPLRDHGLTRTNVAMGTPDYMAPEQRRGEADHRADIYALGALLYEMLTGHTPAGIFDPPSRRARVDARLDRVVERALQQQPERRYQKASEMREELEKVVSSPAASSFMKRPLAIAAVVSCIVTVTGLALYPWREAASKSASAVSPAENKTQTSLSAAGSALTSVETPYPPGRWVKWAEVAGADEIAKALKRDGDWFDVKDSSRPLKVFPAADTARNWGVKATVKHMGRTFQLLTRRQFQPAGYDACYTPAMNLEYLNLSIWRAGFPNARASSRQLSRKLHGSGMISLGDEFTLELAAIGQRIITKVNGRLVHDVTNGELTQGTTGAIIGQPFRDLEFINLDGIPETDALRIIGTGGQPEAVSGDQPFISSDPMVLLPSAFFVEPEWVDFKECFVGRPLAMVNEKEGWLVPKFPRVLIQPNAASNVRNWALRATLRRDRGLAGEMWVRCQPNEKSMAGEVVKLVFDASGKLVMGFDRKTTTGIGTDVIWRMSDAQAAALEESAKVEFMSIGPRFMVRVNDRSIGKMISASCPVGPPAMLATGPFKDLAFINLDRLTDAEALARFGIVEPPGTEPVVKPLTGKSQ